MTRAWPGDDVVWGGTVKRKFEEAGETLVTGSFVVALASRG